MKLIIAGGRSLIVSTYLIEEVLNHYRIAINSQLEIVSGACGRPDDETVLTYKNIADGVDGCGERFALRKGLVVHRKPAQWKLYDRGAGPIRNGEMAAYADELLLIWNGKSSGSRSMRTQMLALKKSVYEVILP